MLTKFNSFISDELDNYINGSLFSTSFLPLVDIIEEKNKFIIEAEVPGYSEENIEITVEGKSLIIKGSMEATTDDKKYYRRERKYGSFSRSFILPNIINEEDILAKFKNGILMVEVPKMPKNVPKKIKILTE